MALKQTPVSTPSYRGTSLPNLFLSDARYDRAAAAEKAQNLDKHYNQRLITNAGDPSSLFRADIDVDDAQSSKYTATVVVGRLESEVDKVDWVFNNLRNVEPAIYIVDNNVTETQLHLDWNHGREAAVYFTYIVDHYDKLSDVTFFWHTDDEVWHNNMLLGWNSTVTINRMDRTNIIKQGYVGSRCDHWPGCPYWVRFDPSRAEDRLDPHRLEGLFNPTTFKELFPDVPERGFPPFFAGTCCSQFAVSRDTIRRHPKSFYENLKRWTMDWDNDDAESGRVFEYTWPYIFTGRGQFCPSMQECYCKAYNFCITDMDQLEQLEMWNSMRTRREEVQWQLNFAEEAMETRLNASIDRGASASEIQQVKQSFQPEIDRLSDNLGNLSQSTWAIREDIIHYWKLPFPPTGW